MYLQQGDVLLKKILHIPGEAVEQKHKTLQTSSGSPNSHRFDAGSKVFLFETSAAEKFIRVDEPSMLRHEEHKHFEVPAGLYVIDLVREMDYDADEVRRVVD